MAFSLFLFTEQRVAITFFLPPSLQGTTGFEAQIDKCLELAEYLYNKIKNREGYEMVFDGKVCITICFSQSVNACLGHLLGCYQQVKPKNTTGISVPCKKKKNQNQTCCCANISLPHGIQGQGR